MGELRSEDGIVLGAGWDDNQPEVTEVDRSSIMGALLTCNRMGEEAEGVVMQWKRMFGGPTSDG